MKSAQLQSKLIIFNFSVSFVKLTECELHKRMPYRNIEYENKNYFMSRILGKYPCSHLYAGCEIMKNNESEPTAHI